MVSLENCKETSLNAFFIKQLKERSSFSIRFIRIANIEARAQHS